MLIIKQQKLPTELIVDILKTINTDEGDLINHHNIEITKILEEPFKLWNKYTTNVLTSSSITRRFSGELFKKRKNDYVMSIQQLLARNNFLETRINFLETRNSFLETRNNFLETRNNFLETRLGVLETRINFLERMIGLPLILLGHQGGFVRSTSPHCVQLGLTEFFDEGYTAYQPFTKIASQTFAINYFEVIFKDVENFELIGVYNKDHDIFIGKSKVLHLNNKPQGRIVLGDLDVDGALTFGCGVLWPAKNKFYKESIPHIFFTLNGQKIGKFVPVESGADTFYPKFDEGKEDGDIFESRVNFGPENFLFNVLELDLLGDDYTQEEWSPL